MATSALTAERITRSLDALHADLDDLPQLAAEWPGFPEGERVSTALHWDHLMADYLPELADHYRTGAMTAAQQARYRALLGKLQAARPAIEQLDFYRPTVPLD